MPAHFHGGLAGGDALDPGAAGQGDRAGILPAGRELQIGLGEQLMDAAGGLAEDRQPGGVADLQPQGVGDQLGNLLVVDGHVGPSRGGAAGERGVDFRVAGDCANQVARIMTTLGSELASFAAPVRSVRPA